MRETKMKLALFTVPEYEKEQEWLAKQHKAGWKLISVSAPCFYTFEKCVPEDVVYQLDYNEEGLKNKSEYVQMFEDCGWEYIADMLGYSYFRKPMAEMKEKEEIFCDDASRMDMIERVFQGRMIPMLVIFFLIIIPQISMMIENDFMAGKVICGIYIVMFVVYIIMFAQFGLQYYRLKKRLEK